MCMVPEQDLGQEGCLFLAIPKGYVHVFVEDVVVVRCAYLLSVGEESVVHCGYVC